MSNPLFILKNKTYTSDPQQIRLEFEPIPKDPNSVDFWADSDKPCGRCEVYVAQGQDGNYPLGQNFRITIIRS